MSAADIEAAAAKFTKHFGPQNNRRAQGAAVVAVGATLLYTDALGEEEGKLIEAHCFSVAKGGWAAHLCGNREAPVYLGVVNDLVTVAGHMLPSPFTMSPLKRDGVCFCWKDDKEAIAVHPDTLRATAKALTGVERLWGASQLKEFVEQSPEYGVWVRQKRIALYFLDEEAGIVKKRATKQSGMILLFTSKLPETVIDQVRKAVADSPPQQPAGGMGDPGSGGEEPGEGDGDDGLEGGRQQLMATLNVRVQGGLPSKLPLSSQ